MSELIGVNGPLESAAGRFRPEALDLRGARPLMLVVVEIDGSLTFLAPDQMNDHNLESLKGSFLRFVNEYKKKRKGRLQV